MDEGGDENSLDSSDYFHTWDDEMDPSDVDQVDEEIYCEVNSNSSSSPQDYSFDYNSDANDNDSAGTDDSGQPAEILEENNNDPNNNMEGGEGNNVEEFEAIVELPVSPQPGCSKYSPDTNDINSEIHRATLRIYNFLHNTTYADITNILQVRPTFEQELNNLFKQSGDEGCLKRTHDGEDICDIEKKKVSNQGGVVENNNGIDEDDWQELPETLLEDAPSVSQQAHQLTPPIGQGQRGTNFTHARINSTPILVDSSDDDSDCSPFNVHIPKRNNVKTCGVQVGCAHSQIKSPMDWRDLKTLTATNGVIQMINTGDRAMFINEKLPLKATVAPATIVREEQASKKASTVAVPYLIRPSKFNEAPVAGGSAQDSLNTPQTSTHVIVDVTPTKLTIVRNLRGVTAVNPLGPLPPSLPQKPASTNPPVPGLELRHPNTDNQQVNTLDPRPGSSTASTSAFSKPPAPLGFCLRDFQQADSGIQRLLYHRCQDPGNRRVPDYQTPILASAPSVPRPDKNIPLPANQSTPMPTISQTSAVPQIPVVTVDDTQNAYPQKKKGEYCREIYTKLRAMFPNIKPDYIKRIIPVDWSPNVGHDVQFAQIVDCLLANEQSWELEIPAEVTDDSSATGSTVRTVDETYEHLLGIFPDADPKYLRDTAEKNVNDDQALEQFIEHNLQAHAYPTRDEYLSKMRITEEQRRYTDKFAVPEFLEKFPDPFKHFMDEKRKCKFQAVLFEFLKGQFNRIRVNTISKVYNESGYIPSIAAARLREIGLEMTSTRKSNEMPTEDINMLQEMAFIRHQNEITSYIDHMKQIEKIEFEKLKNSNELLECQCCYDDQCMPSKCSMCDQGHIFCNSCIIKGTDSRLGEGETHVPCFQACGAEFSLSTLQNILKPTKFSIIVKKRQAAEVAAAGLEGLVSCPFCHFASIPPEGDKVFKCLNPECMKESCIQCKEPNHVPLRCDEVGKIDKARKYIEEKMTEAFARKCYNCKRAYFKEEGCNKITCPCGAIMCYLCDKKIKDYSHFRGQGSDDMTKCPLHSDNARLNAEIVRRVANEAKKELLRQDPLLSIDTDRLLPTVPPPSAGPHQQIIQDARAIAQMVQAAVAVHAINRRIDVNPRHVHNRQ